MSSSSAAAASPSVNLQKTISVQYLEKHKNKNDLVNRLRRVSDILRHDSNVEPDSAECPGLATMAAALVSDFLGHKDKEVRLYAVLCCMELFSIYAPAAPWSDTEVCYIFQQTIRQMANLAHTTGPRAPHYKSYMRILELLAVVKIGAVLVDLAKDLGDSALEKDEDEEDNLPANVLVDSPLELLCELFRTLLQSLRTSHPNEVAEYSQKAISSCLEEYHGGSGVSVPLPLVEEILISVGQPKILATNPAVLLTPAQQQQQQRSAGKRNDEAATPPSIPLQVELNNPSYVVAVAIVRKHLDSLSTPVSNLLNGLINGEPHIVQRSSIVADDEDDDNDDKQHASGGVVDVWTIVYELGKVAPSILTTVIGTVSTCLTCPEASKRHKTVKLLGKLFYARGSKVATNFAPCFREWLRRFADCEPEIRCTMVLHLVSILQESRDREVIREADATLVRMLYDRKTEVRLLAVHRVSDFVYANMKEKPVSLELLQALGLRVMSKDPSERRDALVGLCQIYYKYYVQDTLQGFQQFGDEQGDKNSIQLVSQILTKHCCQGDVFYGKGRKQTSPTTNELYGWIPSRIFDCMSIPQSVDPEMRARVVQIVDTILLGSQLSKKASKQLSPAARATGLAIIVDSLRKKGQSVWETTDTTNAFHHMVLFFRLRNIVQKQLGHYIDARTNIREHKAGSEEALVADASAREKLSTLGTMLPTPKGTSLEVVLDKLHGARDKHIWRLLAGLANADHGKSARKRAADELPKRTKSLGDPVRDWVMTLVCRCSMGDFFNAEVVRSCISLASECFSEQDISSCVALLSCAKVAIGVFPSICNSEESFELLKEMFSTCRELTSSSRKGELKQKIVKSGLATALSSLLTVVARTKQNAVQKEPQQRPSSTDKGLRKELLQVCTNHGTPQQARNAVDTFVTLYSSKTSNEGLLKELTSPSKMTISAGCTKPEQVVSILSALAALVDRAPHTVSCSARGENAVKFAMETILLGRSGRSSNGGDLDSESDDSDNDDKKTPRRKASSSKVNQSPVEEKCLLDNTQLSLATRRICAAIEFLVSYIRSTILASAFPQASTDSGDQRVVLLSSDRLRSLFEVLVQIIRDQGLPQCNRDRAECRARQDRAAIRQCAAINLLRLCDRRLNLEEPYLSTDSWHTLGGMFLDEEPVVRCAVVEELVVFLTGQEGYEPPKGAAKLAPALRFAAFIVLCADADGVSANSRVNGNAARVGKISQRVKAAAQKCIINMRQGCDRELAQCAVGSRQMDKVSIFLPEYITPHAFHLLTYRREGPSEAATPERSKSSIGAANRTSDGSSKSLDEAAKQKMLKKRLKFLFEPLIFSLGDGADNISFLLSMTQSLAGCSPISVSERASATIESPGSFGGRLSLDSNDRDNELVPAKDSGRDVAEAKLRCICSVSRLLLLSFVKKDVNLSEYPGSVRIPAMLFKIKGRPVRATEGSKMKRSRSGKSQRPTAEVQFSPEVEAASPPGGKLSPGFSKFSSPGMSPILKSGTPTGDATPQDVEMTDRETPTSNWSGKRSLRSNEKVEQFDVESDETVPDEDSDEEGGEPLTQEVRARKKRRSIPSQIKIGHSPSVCAEAKGKCQEGIPTSQKVKPLGDSNRARTKMLNTKHKGNEVVDASRAGMRRRSLRHRS